MKHRLHIALLMIVALAVLAACQDNNITNPQSEAPQDQQELIPVQTADIKGNWRVVESVYPITAGRNEVVGRMGVLNDGEYLYVNYSIYEPWYMSESHLAIGENLADIPRNKPGIPIPGQFAYSDVHNPYVSNYSYAIPLSEVGVELGETIYFAAHAVVKKLNDNGQVIQSETAWGGDIAGPGPRWWFYGQYQMQFELRGLAGRELESERLDPADDRIWF